MGRNKKIQDPIQIAKPHTIKKFELISEYVDGWSRKILNYENSKGILYIDCMCNSGKYYDEDSNLIDGTAIKVVKILDKIMEKHHNKKAVVIFNDLDNLKVEKLMEFLKELRVKNLEIFFNVGDANDLLNKINLCKYPSFNTLLVYDPYDAAINWEALNPFLNTWGEVIINHMVLDTVRGAAIANKVETISKYENTYQKTIDEIICCGSNKKELDRIVIDIIKSQKNNSNRKNYIASFPFFNRNNGLVYNLIHVSCNVKGLILFKKIAWKTFGDKSSLKNTHGHEFQFQMNFKDSLEICTETDESCYYIKDIAKYIYDKFSNSGTVPLEEIYCDLNVHPIFPSDGFKRKILSELGKTYGVSIERNQVNF